MYTCLVRTILTFLYSKSSAFAFWTLKTVSFIERFPVSRLPPHTLFDLMLKNKWITAVITNLFNLKITLKNKQGFFKLLLGGTFYFNQTAYVDLTSILLSRTRTTWQASIRFIQVTCISQTFITLLYEITVKADIYVTLWKTKTNKNYMYHKFMHCFFIYL